MPVIPRARRDTDGEIKLVNLTPHEICILLPSGPHVLPASGDAPRLEFDESEETPISTHGVKIPLFELGNLHSSQLPDPRRNIYYVVSAVVAAANRTRKDLLVVHHYERNERGMVVGCRALARFESSEARIDPIVQERSS
jgi:hypothetical protein